MAARQEEQPVLPNIGELPAPLIPLGIILKKSYQITLS
jgi:hypothetical protein